MKYSIHTLAAAAVLALALPAQALTVTGSATSAVTTLNKDAVITLTLNVSEDFMPTALTFNLDWPAARLSLNPDASKALGMSWTVLAQSGVLDPEWTEINAGPNHLGVSSIGTLPLLSAGVHTVQIAFTGLAVGTHNVTYDLGLGAPDFSTDYVVAGSTTVTVSAVPEADTAAMLAAGLAVMGLLARRRRA